MTLLFSLVETKLVLVLHAVVKQATEAFNLLHLTSTKVEETNPERLYFNIKTA